MNMDIQYFSFSTKEIQSTDIIILIVTDNCML